MSNSRSQPDNMYTSHAFTVHQLDGLPAMDVMARLACCCTSHHQLDGLPAMDVMARLACCSMSHQMDGLPAAVVMARLACCCMSRHHLDGLPAVVVMARLTCCCMSRRGQPPKATLYQRAQGRDSRASRLVENYSVETRLKKR